jgi:type II secretory pathway component GspD/PulD (secretin)
MKHVSILLLRCMRISLTQAFLSCIFAGISIANDLSAQELLNRRMSINVNDKKVKTVLKEIEKATNAKFSYSPQVIQSGSNVTLHMENATLAEILEKIFTPLNVTLDVTKSQIILKKQLPLPKAATEKVGTEQEALSNISGKVSDENKNALPGVSVVLKGTNLGTTTDSNGEYSLTFNAEEPVLIFSYVGYISQEVVVGAQTRLDVSLQPDNKAQFPR